jgi:glucose-1-phosphate thymidylyltransferase
MTALAGNALEGQGGARIACVEVAAYHMGYITAAQVEALARPLRNSYGKYSLEIVAQPA